MKSTLRQVPILASDAGGTMTDLFIVDAEGNFRVGKAATTPKDESIGFWESLCDAFAQWGIDLEKESEKILPNSRSAIYSGTTMLNVLLTGTGRKVGVIITKGFEDPIVWNIATQGWIGYSYADTMHVATHNFPPELVSRKLIKGVTERIDMFGKEVIPLYEHEAEAALRDLVRRGVDAIAVCFIYSYLKPAHEQKVREIAERVMKEQGKRIPVYLSYDVVPIMREAHRLNATVIQAYAAEPARIQLSNIEKRIQGRGYKNPLQTVTASGGLVNIRYPRLVETLVSGPIGGLIGTKFLADTLGIGNIVGTDLGGTSFDVGLIRGGVYPVRREVAITQRLLNIPSIVMDSIGAGCGMYVTIDPLRGRIQIGPESAGSDPGPISYDRGNEVPTVMDCDLILGILNPDNYLGGKIKLNKDKAFRFFKEKVADVLGMNPYDAAEVVIRMLNLRARDFLSTNLKARGYTPADFHLIGYGGAGPMHLAGYVEGLDFKGVLTVPFAAGFSSFGCATIDYTHHYQRSTVLGLPPHADDQTKMSVSQALNKMWDELEEMALREMKAEGIPAEQVKIRPTAYLRYGQQLDDLEVYSPVDRIRSPKDMDSLVSEFEAIYERVYTAIAKNPEAGYQILEVGLTSYAPSIKPALKKHPLQDKVPSAQALKGTRDVYISGAWMKGNIYDMAALRPGNEIKGLAIIEATNTTFLVPPGKSTYLDEYEVFWLR